jgi:hypothetical protein
MNKLEDILKGVEMNKNGVQIIAKVPLRLTDAKLEVLVEVAKAWGMELSEVIEDAIDHDIRALLESSSDVGEALNKILCDTSLKEIGGAPEGDLIWQARALTRIKQLRKKFTETTEKMPSDSSWEDLSELIEQGIRGKKRSKINQLRIMTEIKKLLLDKDDYEIMKILGIPNSTYYRYKSQIYQEDRELWNQIAKESLESRALKIMKSLELCIAVNTEIATDKQQDPKSRIEASIKLVDANIMVYNILENGPKPQLINYS